MMRSSQILENCLTLVTLSYFTKEVSVKVKVEAISEG